MNLNPDRQNKNIFYTRKEPIDSLDYYPTPPWATRALMNIIGKESVHDMKCLEPSCGEGHMSNVLKEYFKKVYSTDIHDYNKNQDAVVDLLDKEVFPNNFCDWVITNPPFNLALEFIQRSHDIAKVGVAMFCRTTILEGKKRFENLYKNNPPNIIAQFVERVPIDKGKINRKAASAVPYLWLVWNKNSTETSKLMWIPPCKKELEREEDYE